MGYKVELVRMFVYAVLSFVLTMGLTPLMTYILYKYKVWKKPQKVSSLDKKKTPIYMKLHADKHKRNIPFMAGIVVWVSVAILTFVFNLSREQTYLPLFVMITMGLVGLVETSARTRSRCAALSSSERSTQADEPAAPHSNSQDTSPRTRDDFPMSAYFRDFCRAFFCCFRSAFFLSLSTFLRGFWLRPMPGSV